jgi:hypothetical protein
MYGVAYSPSVLDHVAKAMWDCSIRFRFRMAARTYGHRGHGQLDLFLSHGHVIDLEGVSSWRSNTNTVTVLPAYVLRS